MLNINCNFKISIDVNNLLLKYPFFLIIATYIRRSAKQNRSKHHIVFYRYISKAKSFFFIIHLLMHFFNDLSNRRKTFYFNLIEY